MTRTLGKLSVVAPVLNEEETLALFHERLCQVLADIDFEIVLVDDGSTDSTPELLEDLAERDPRVGVVRLSRNFGYQAAMAAGLDHATGDVVVTIDSDLQDPPELIPKLIERWEEGVDVVYAYRDERPGESWAKLATSRWFTKIFAKLARIDLPHNVGDFRLLDRAAVDALLAMREHARFMRGMAVWVGFVQATVPYRRDPRFAGETRYKWGTLIRISIDGLTSFSRAPLQLATVIGFIVSGIAFLAIPAVIIGRIFGIDYAEGISTVLLVVLLLGGIQLITLGIVGEYVSRVYEEVKGRPLYLVRATHNIDVEAARTARDAAAGRAATR